MTSRRQSSERRTPLTIEISLLLSGVSVAFAIFFGICSKQRNEKKDTQEDAEQRATTDTMVMVKLENIADDLKDIKRESRENREEMKSLRDRVVIVEELSQETGRRTAFRPITGGQETGKNQPHRKEAIHENDRTGTSHQNPASEKNVSDKRAKRET